MGPFQVGMDAARETWLFPSRKRPNLLTSNADLAIQRCSSRLLNISALSKRDAPNSTEENRPDMCDEKSLQAQEISQFCLWISSMEKGSAKHGSRSSPRADLQSQQHWTREFHASPQIKPSFSSSSDLVLLQLPFQRGQQLYYAGMGQSMQTVKITPG